MPLKVHCLGFRGVGSQVDRIEEGFRALGWEVTPYISDAALVYANDSGAFDQIITDKARGVIRGKVIFNQLDLAPHVPNFPLARVHEQLTHADAVTTISHTVARDIKARLGLDAHVVYNPMRKVERARGRQHPYRFLFVGRVGDPEKRAMIGAAAVSILGFGWDDMVTVGREVPPYGGIYWGTATDEVLSDLYNSADFLICPTRNAFLGLPILEAMACGCIPVVCNDLDIRAEFLPPSVFPEYNEVTPDAPSIARFIARYVNDEGAKAELSQRLWTYWHDELADKLSPRGVAAAIVRVFEAL